MFRQRGYLKFAVDPNDAEDLFNAAESTQCAFDFDEWEDASSGSRGIEVGALFLSFCFVSRTAT
jgi:hypothetical protein